MAVQVLPAKAERGRGGGEGVLRSAARDVPSLRAQVARLEALLSELGARSGEVATIEALRKEVTRLSRDVGRGNKATGDFHKKPDKEKERAESIRETAKMLSRENLSLHRENRIPGETAARVRAVTDENCWLRLALEGSRFTNRKLTARIARFRAATLTKLPFDEAAHLRNVLRRSRRQKTTIRRLHKENTRLRRAVKGTRRRIEILEAGLDKLRAAGSVLSKKLHGRKSAQQDKPRSERKRGQQRGAPGHGRTQRPGLDERREEHDPPPDACVCASCGQPCAPNGAEESSLVEIEVKACKRVIGRPRWRRTCECASSAMEVSAPPVPRLFVRTPCGISFRARFLFEHCACFRPVHRVAAWFSGHGLPVSPGTLADSLKRFVPLFEAILAHQNTAALRHADETSWRVQELRGDDRSSRAWLWASVSSDAVCFRIDPSRSAEAAHKLFAGALMHTVIVCDRYSACKRLVSLLGGLVILAFCWSHVRRDLVECAAGQVKLTRWCQGWIERIAEIHRLNEARLEHHDPGLKRQAPAFDAMQAALDGLFADAREELAGLPDQAREGAALAPRSPRGAERLRRSAPDPNGQQPRRKTLARAGNRTGTVIRLRQRDGCRVHGDHVLGAGHALDERHRRPALARSVVGGMRRERSAAAGRPVALAAVVDERGPPARSSAGITGATSPPMRWRCCAP